MVLALLVVLIVLVLVLLVVLVEISVELSTSKSVPATAGPWHRKSVPTRNKKCATDGECILPGRGCLFHTLWARFRKKIFCTPSM